MVGDGIHYWWVPGPQTVEHVVEPMRKVDGVPRLAFSRGGKTQALEEIGR